MERTGFWSRIGQWFQGGANASRQAPHHGGHAAATDAPEFEASDDDHATGDSSRWGRLGRPSPRQSEIDKLQNQLRELNEGLNANLREQSEQFTAAGQSLREIGEGLKTIAAAVETQRGLLERVAGRMDDQAGSARRSEQSLAGLPKLAESQQALTASLTQHLELSRKMSDQVAQTLERLHEALASIGGAVQASTDAVKDLRREGIARQEELTALVRENGRRLTWAAGAALGLLALAAAAGWITVFR